MWHPIDLPEGYHTASPEAEPNDARAGPVEGCPRGCRVVGLRQVDGTPHTSPACNIVGDPAATLRGLLLLPWVA
jgi:hypothetical protein